MGTFRSRWQQGCVEMIPGAANGTAACGVPGSGLGDTKRAVSFFQPFGARDSCPASADDDELYRHIAQQGDAGATAAHCRVTPSMGILSTSSRLLPGADTPPFLGLSEQSQFDATMPTPTTAS